MVQAISWLKKNIEKPLRVEELARQRAYVDIEPAPPFQGCHRVQPPAVSQQLRLYEAQRLMLAENERAASAAMAVGYESVTQFNREYKRLFGEPPHRDMIRRRERLL